LLRLRLWSFLFVPFASALCDFAFLPIQSLNFCVPHRFDQLLKTADEPQKFAIFVGQICVITIAVETVNRHSTRTSRKKKMIERSFSAVTITVRPVNQLA